MLNEFNMKFMETLIFIVGYTLTQIHTPPYGVQWNELYIVGTWNHKSTHNPYFWEDHTNEPMEGECTLGVLGPRNFKIQQSNRLGA